MNGLNVNFNQTINKFESAMRKKMLIKNIFYKKVFGGRGFEFDSFRSYSYGDDDSSLIDWKATLKNGGMPLIRQYIEERDLNVFVLVDIGDNMIFGSGERLKSETAAEIAVALTHLVIIAGDKVGFGLFNDKLSKVRPFSPGLEQFYYFLKNISNIQLYGGKSNLKNALENIKPYLKKSTAVFIISDFINIDDAALNYLKSFVKQRETVGIMVRDNVDTKLSDIKGEIIVEDIYSGERLLINPGLIKDEFEKHALKQKEQIINLFKKSGADMLEITNNQEFIVPLVEFLKRRTKKRKVRIG